MSSTVPSIAPPADRRAALDRAHLGDIEGAIGTVQSHDTAARRTLHRRLMTFLAVAGPGLIVMAADNDAGTMTVFGQAGHGYGTRLLWLLVLIAPVLFVVQEMAARLGAVTGAGHARLILERFGRVWCAFSVGDLIVLNFACRPLRRRTVRDRALNASLLGAGAVSLSSAYATGEVLGVKHSLHRRFRDARTFHGCFAAFVITAAATVLIPGAPLGAITTLVQALAGILLPVALVLLLTLCNDRELVGPLTNPRGLNAITVAAVT
jgi:Mn2+/Fe2+ NRAMP family transporter